MAESGSMSALISFCRPGLNHWGICRADNLHWSRVEANSSLRGR